MNFNFYLSILIFAFGTVSQARIGVDSSGGGDQLAAEFSSLALNLVNEGGLESKDQAICQKALQTTKIVSVAVLQDPVSNKPIANQANLIAWGSPGLIQIKQDSGRSGEISWQSLRREGKPVLQYVFHELYRASGVLNSQGRSPDESFELSIGRYHLDSLPNSVNILQCYQDINAILYSHFKTANSALLDFKNTMATKDLGGSIGIVGFARVNTWGEANGHLHYFAISATCTDNSGTDIFRLKDASQNGKLDTNDITINHIDFDRF